MIQLAILKSPYQMLRNLNMLVRYSVSSIYKIIIFTAGCVLLSGTATAAKWSAPSDEALTDLLNNKTHRIGKLKYFYTSNGLRAHLDGKILRNKTEYKIFPEGKVCHQVGGSQECVIYQTKKKKVRISLDDGKAFKKIKIIDGIPRYVAVSESTRLNRAEIIAALTDATLYENHKKYEFSGYYTHDGAKGWHRARSWGNDGGPWEEKDEGPWEANEKDEYCSAWNKWSKGDFRCFKMYVTGKDVIRVLTDTETTNSEDPAYYYTLLPGNPYDVK